MFVDLIEHLRCPAAHDESWLVAAVERMAGRYVSLGSLGCPVCQATYDIRDFVAHFAPARAATTLVRQTQRPEDDAVVRLAALLDLRAAGGFVGLAGGWAPYAAPLALAFDVQCVVFDRAGLGVPGDGVSVLSVGERIPLAPGSLRALALDSASTAISFAVHAVRAGGRVTGPTALVIPEGVNELARDATDWVGEVVADASPLVGIARSR
jgi:uncharacterized protein YbaR (Trm112 family)